METAPFKPSKVSCYAGMNTKSSISCCEIFYEICMVLQQLSRLGWVADGQQNSPAKDSAIWPPSREADLRAEQLHQEQIAFNVDQKSQAVCREATKRMKRPSGNRTASSFKGE
jgi:hypothetical protein